MEVVQAPARRLEDIKARMLEQRRKTIARTRVAVQMLSFLNTLSALQSLDVLHFPQPPTSSEVAPQDVGAPATAGTDLEAESAEACGSSGVKEGTTGRTGARARTCCTVLAAVMKVGLFTGLVCFSGHIHRALDVYVRD